MTWRRLDRMKRKGSCWHPSSGPVRGGRFFVAELGAAVVGFVSMQLDPDTQIGEIGLNAVHPDHAGKGIGTAMYNLTLARMKEAGMRVADCRHRRRSQPCTSAPGL